MAKVLIAERNGATRAAIRAALERAGHGVCAECSDAASAVRAAERTRPAVCLVDLDLPGGGITLTRALAAQAKAPRVIVLAARARDTDFFAALRAGAQGFLVKDIDPRRLPQEVESVAGTGAALSRELTARLIEQFRLESRSAIRCTDRKRNLPGRERELLELLAAEALTPKEAAARLRLSPTTIRRRFASAVAELSVAARRVAVGRCRDAEGPRDRGGSRFRRHRGADDVGARRKARFRPLRAGRDRAVADAVDLVASDCEEVERP